jgi:hypothetical protein
MPLSQSPPWGVVSGSLIRKSRLLSLQIHTRTITRQPTARVLIQRAGTIQSHINPAIASPSKLHEAAVARRPAARQQTATANVSAIANRIKSTNLGNGSSLRAGVFAIGFFTSQDPTIVQEKQRADRWRDRKVLAGRVSGA